MASALSIALRRDDALGRIETALKEMGVEVEEDALRSPVHDPEVRLANTLEAIAGGLERATAKTHKAAKQTKKSDEPAQDAEA
jgi:hypothetical protein